MAGHNSHFLAGLPFDHLQISLSARCSLGDWHIYVAHDGTRRQDPSQAPTGSPWSLVYPFFCLQPASWIGGFLDLEPASHGFAPRFGSGDFQR
jgi:hypothetical protein